MRGNVLPLCHDSSRPEGPGTGDADDRGAISAADGVRPAADGAVNTRQNYTRHTQSPETRFLVSFESVRAVSVVYPVVSDLHSMELGVGGSRGGVWGLMPPPKSTRKVLFC